MLRLNRLLLALVVLTLSAGLAGAHSWYPLSCCGNGDCRELAEDKGEVVSETSAGWRLWDGRVVGKALTRVSPNSRFHLCEVGKAIICFYAPPGSS